jgi:hypothetical protein
MVAVGLGELVFLAFRFLKMLSQLFSGHPSLFVARE